MKKSVLLALLTAAACSLGSSAQAASTGDFNNDGAIDIDDVNLLINVMLHKSDIDEAVADVTGDGTVDIDDLNKFINVMLHKDSFGDDYTIDPPVTPPTGIDDKAFLELTATTFAQQFKANDFRNIAELVRGAKDYDTSEVEEWFDDCWQAMSTALGEPRTETQVESYDPYEYTYIYNYIDYKTLIKASLFTGHFTVANGKWHRTPASDLQFTFTDRMGNPCVARLTTSGNTKEVHLLDQEFWDQISWAETEEYHYRVEYVEGERQIFVMIPEHITLTFTQGGNTLVNAKADIDVSGIKSTEWDLGRDALSVKAIAQVNNYTVEASRAVYNPADGAHAVVKISRGNDVLLYGGADAQGYADLSYGEDLDDDFDTSTLGAAAFTFNLMGWLQIKGTVGSVHSLARALQNAQDNDNNEQEFKRYIDRANSQFDCQFYYRGEATSHGTIAIEPYLEDYWNGYEYWSFEPIITFASDGSSYAFETYFTEDVFPNATSTFRNLVDDFLDLYDLTGLDR